MYINFLDAKVKKLKPNWFQLTKEFTATGNESCLIIGNFNAADNRRILKERNNGYRISLMIDDIAVTPLQNIVCQDYQQRKDSLYAIHRRHSEDSALAKPELNDTTVMKKTTDSVVTIKNNKIDTLHLSNILFQFDRYKLLNPDTLETFRPVLTNRAIKKIEIIGYTDDAGSPACNKELSSKRAAEIARQIVLRFGVAPTVIHVEGKGISNLYNNKNLNRRVDIYIYYQEP